MQFETLCADAYLNPELNQIMIKAPVDVCGGCRWVFDGQDLEVWWPFKREIQNWWTHFCQTKGDLLVQKFDLKTILPGFYNPYHPWDDCIFFPKNDWLRATSSSHVFGKPFYNPFDPACHPWDWGTFTSHGSMDFFHENHSIRVGLTSCLSMS